MSERPAPIDPIRGDTDTIVVAASRLSFALCVGAACAIAAYVGPSLRWGEPGTLLLCGALSTWLVGKVQPFAVAWARGTRPLFGVWLRNPGS